MMQQQRTIVITGANGFVGRHLVMRAIELDYRVVALSRNTEWLNSVDANNLIVHTWDAGDPPHSAFEGVDAVFHLAAFVPPNMSDAAYAEQCFHINAMLAHQVIQVAHKCGASRFIYFSSGNIYNPIIQLASEEDAVYPVGHASYYLTSKISGEIFTQYFARQHGIASNMLRVSSVYGPGMKPSGVIYHFVRNALQKQPLIINNGGSYHTDFVFVEDVVNGALLLLTQDKTGIFNIGSGRATTLLELAETILEELQESHDLLDIRLESPSTFDGFAALNIRKAVDQLGFSPTPLRKGLSEYTHWLRAHL